MSLNEESIRKIEIKDINKLIQLKLDFYMTTTKDSRHDGNY
jgi:hypothetical protein